MIDRRDS